MVVEEVVLVLDITIMALPMNLSNLLVIGLMITNQGKAITKRHARIIKNGTYSENGTRMIISFRGLGVSMSSSSLFFLNRPLESLII